jgi:hypothetical protein
MPRRRSRAVRPGTLWSGVIGNWIAPRPDSTARPQSYGRLPSLLNPVKMPSWTRKTRAIFRQAMRETGRKGGKVGGKRSLETMTPGNQASRGTMTNVRLVALNGCSWPPSREKTRLEEHFRASGMTNEQIMRSVDRFRRSTGKLLRSWGLSGEEVQHILDEIEKQSHAGSSGRYGFRRIAGKRNCGTFGKAIAPRFVSTNFPAWF